MIIDVPHGCGRTHRGYQSLAECCWPGAAYVTGDGPFAVVSRCGLLEVSLHASREEARRRHARLEQHGCGRCCEGRHEVAELVQPASSSAF